MRARNDGTIILSNDPPICTSDVSPDRQNLQTDVLGHSKNPGLVLCLIRPACRVAWLGDERPWATAAEIQV